MGEKDKGYIGPIGLGVRYSNGRKDPGFKYLIQFTPKKVDEAIKEVTVILKNMEKYKKEVQEHPERYDLDRDVF